MLRLCRQKTEFLFVFFKNFPSQLKKYIWVTSQTFLGHISFKMEAKWKTGETNENLKSFLESMTPHLINIRVTIWFVVSAQVQNLISSDGMSVNWCLSNWQFEMSHCDRYICPSDMHICTCHRNTKNNKTPSVFGAQLDFGAQYKTVEQSSH